MVKPVYLAIGGVIAAGAAWWYLRGKAKPTDTTQKPISLDISMPNTSGGGSSSSVLDYIDNILNSGSLLPIATVLPNSTGTSTAVSPGVVAPQTPVSSGGGQSYPEPAPGPGIEELRRQANEAKANGGLSGLDYLFNPAVQAYSSDFAAHNANGGGRDFVTAVGGLDGYMAGNRA